MLQIILVDEKLQPYTPTKAKERDFVEMFEELAIVIGVQIHVYLLISIKDKLDADADTEMVPPLPLAVVRVNRTIFDEFSSPIESDGFRNSVMTMVHELIHVAFKNSINAVYEVAEDKKWCRIYSMLMELDTENMAQAIGDFYINSIIAPARALSDEVIPEPVIKKVKIGG